MTRIYLNYYTRPHLNEKIKRDFDESKGRIKVIIYLRYPRHPRLKNEMRGFCPTSFIYLTKQPYGNIHPYW